MRFLIGGVSFSYGSEKVLDRIAFEVRGGDLVAILGRNGAGKSTLLRCLNGILTPDGGFVEIDGSRVTGMRRREIAKEIGYAAQKADTSRLTVFESVLLGRRPHIDFDATESDLRLAGRVIDLVGLTELSGKFVDEISGGEYQLVQIARAFVQHPKVILFDEPTNNLDPANQHKVMHLIMRVVKENGMAALMVIHDLNLALSHADRFIMMRDGKVFAAGGAEILTSDNIKRVYGFDCYVETVHGLPVVVPKEEDGRPHAHGLQNDFFDQNAECWDEINHSDPGKLRYIVNLLSLRGSESVLDVGTGTGVMMPYYEDRLESGSAKGIDISERMIGVAKEKFPPSEHPKVSFEATDLYDYDPGRGYDRIVCYACFPHFSDKPKAVAHLASLLADGGKLMIAHSDSREDIARIHHGAGGGVEHDLPPAMEDMRRMYADAGLEVYFERDDGDYFIIVGGKPSPG